MKGKQRYPAGAVIHAVEDVGNNILETRSDLETTVEDALILSLL